MDYLTALGFDGYVATGLTATATRWLPPHVVHERLTSLRSLVLPGSREAALWDWYRAALFDTALGFAYLPGGVDLPDNQFLYAAQDHPWECAPLADHPSNTSEAFSRSSRTFGNKSPERLAKSAGGPVYVCPRRYVHPARSR